MHVNFQNWENRNLSVFFSILCGKNQYFIVKHSPLRNNPQITYSETRLNKS